MILSKIIHELHRNLLIPDLWYQHCCTCIVFNSCSTSHTKQVLLSKCSCNSSVGPKLFYQHLCATDVHFVPEICYQHCFTVFVSALISCCYCTQSCTRAVIAAWLYHQMSVINLVHNVFTYLGVLCDQKSYFKINYSTSLSPNRYNITQLSHSLFLFRSKSSPHILI